MLHLQTGIRKVGCVVRPRKEGTRLRIDLRFAPVVRLQFRGEIHRGERVRAKVVRLEGLGAVFDGEGKSPIDIYNGHGQGYSVAIAI